MRPGRGRYALLSVAGTRDAHEKIAAAVIQPLDVGQHAHGGMLLKVGGGVHAVPRPSWCCMRARRDDLWHLTATPGAGSVRAHGDA